MFQQVLSYIIRNILLEIYLTRVATFSVMLFFKWALDWVIKQ